MQPRRWKQTFGFDYHPDKQKVNFNRDWHPIKKELVAHLCPNFFDPDWDNLMRPNPENPFQNYKLISKDHENGTDPESV